MHEECLICGAPLEYLDADVPMTCALCGKTENSKSRCEPPQNIRTAQKSRYVGKKQDQQECRSESGGAPVFA